jgi:xylan 1,4-beta-xylosidase
MIAQILPTAFLVLRLMVLAVSFVAAPSAVFAAEIAAPQRTYCNPINIDYGYCPIPNFVTNGKHRATADPAVVMFRGDYYLCSTNQWGYWWSGDMSQWTFVPRKFLKPHHDVYDELCAPALLVMDDALHVLGSTYTHDFPVWKSTNPRRDEWTEATPALEVGAWDPALFLDDDGRLYLYHGSSNDKPLWGVELDRRSWKPIGEQQALLRLDDAAHGWERFGEANDNTWLRPFSEGAWMTKHDGKYYLQYSAPGTEFSGYADGVYVGDAPLGPFRYQDHNPVSYKPGGFARGAGHGSTFQDAAGGWWHASTITISVKNSFERRLGIWPAGFDDEGVMFCNTAYGDYPHTLPAAGQGGAARDGSSSPSGGQFAGWMLLNYAKPVTVSTSLPGCPANHAVDEDIKTYWSAASGDASEWIVSDLGATSDVHAIQLNYADQDADVMGKQPGLHHQYLLQASLDGRAWTTIVDKSDSQTDAPHDYVEFAAPVEARYIRLENRHVPTGKFALSGLRVFGHGRGAAPPAVEGLEVLRGDGERRNAWLRWRAVPEATGYVIYAGVDPNKLYTSVMVYGACDWWFRAMNADQAYYFQIEAFNENGISARSPVVEAH